MEMGENGLLGVILVRIICIEKIKDLCPFALFTEIGRIPISYNVEYITQALHYLSLT